MPTAMANVLSVDKPPSLFGLGLLLLDDVPIDSVSSDVVPGVAVLDAIVPRAEVNTGEIVVSDDAGLIVVEDAIPLSSSCSCGIVEKILSSYSN